MKIEIQKFDRMTQTGKSLLDILQNNEIPILDLFIREGVQNSLDAADKSKDRFVNIDFIYKDFNSNQFALHMDGVKDVLLDRYPGKQKYIALRDSKTTGLTGHLQNEDVGDDREYGNLLSLVYSISKPKTDESAGGSWGLGKTSYFRMGNGIVIYYTRIKLDSGEYQSRLAVSLVENEESHKTLLTSKKGEPSQGLAWWGEEYRPGKTRPITDEKVIKAILDSFDFPLYADKETGTSIIIPYIDDEKLLSDNKPTYDSDTPNAFIKPDPYWYSDVEEYMKLAVQRWYFPRLDNSLYRGKHFKLRFNNKEFIKDDLEPLFKVMTDLYNISSTPHGVKENFLFYPNLSSRYHKDSISITRSLKDSLAGHVVSILVTKKELEETVPNNRNSAYEMINLRRNPNDPNEPIIGYSRKPGLVVSYETSESDWVKNIDSTKTDEYILAFFTLNSDNTLRSTNYGLNEEPMTLEGYVRSGEKADHAGWYDQQFLGESQNIVRRIKLNTSSKISQKYNFVEEIIEGERRSLNSSKYASALLPSISFGKQASRLKRSEIVKNTRKNSVGKKERFAPLRGRISYSSNGVNIPFEYSTAEPIEALVIDLLIATETGNLKVEDYEITSGRELPFSIKSINLKSTTNDQENYKIFVGAENLNDAFQYIVNYTPRGKAHSILVNFNNPLSGVYVGDAEIILNSKTLKMNLSIKGVKEVISNE